MVKKGIWVGATVILGLIVAIGIAGWFMGDGTSGLPVAGSQPLSAASSQQSAAGTLAQPLIIQEAGCAPGTTTPDYIGTDRLESGTSVKGTQRAAVYTNGGYSTFSTGTASTLSRDTDYAILFVNNTDYHNAFVEKCHVPCTGSFQIGTGVCGYEGNNENATLTITVFNENNDVISNSTRDGTAIAGTQGPANAATNQTSKGSGSTYNFQMKFDGEDKASSQDLTCVFEGTNSTALDDLIVTHPTKTVKVGTKPRFQQALLSTSDIFTWNLPEVKGAVSDIYNLQVKTTSGEDLGTSIGSSILYRCWTKEHFIDIDGTITYGVENQNGVQQSIAVYGGGISFT